MANCDKCDEHENMPYNCRHCGGTYCSDHRLPENHDCPGLEDWGDPDGVFDSGFDDSVRTSNQPSEGGVLDGLNTGTGGVLGYFRGNMTYVFLALMWFTFFVQQIIVQLGLLPAETYLSIFTLSTAHPLFVWTWFTSIFAHSTQGLFHIAGNSIVIFFFGRLLEEYVGSEEYTALFLASGALAGLGQVWISLIQSQPAFVLGASGAGLAIMGALTVLNPDLRVYLYFLVPVPIWALTGFYALISAVGILGGSAGGIANGAHLVGLILGVAYGTYVKRNRDVRVQGGLRFGGGGPGGPGRGGGRGPF